jgi:hypothetical protein
LHSISLSKLKPKKKLNNRGFSSIVGAIFMILIVGLLASGYFMFTLSQNVTYNDAVRSVNQQDVEYQTESLNITAQPVYNTAQNSVHVIVNIQNDGPIFVQIRTLWVHAVNNSKYGFVNCSASPILTSGQSLTIDKTISVSGATVGENYYGWLITGRGKTILLYPAHQTGPQGPQGIQGPPADPSVVALVSQGIGSISLDFKSFRVYTTDYSNNILSTSAAFTFSRSSNIAFSVNVTNLDPSHLPLNLTSNSCEWIFSPASGAIKGDVWKIANFANNQINPLTQSQFIIFPYNQTTTLYFGPTNAGQNSLSAGVTGVNLILTGKIGSLDYGQNLPFISLIAT